MIRSAFLGCVLLALGGCEVSADTSRDDYPATGEPVPRGSVAGRGGERTLDGDADLSIDWTIDGTRDPAACDDFDVDHATITIEDDDGVVDEVDVQCEAFGYDFRSLPAGSYFATIVLRDVDDDDVTEVQETDTRDLPPGSSAHVSIDFDEDSFL